KDCTWSVRISEPRQAEHAHQPFTPQIDPATGKLETIAQFLARWPIRGCIFGGPVRGGFLNQPDRGGWEMKIDGQNFGQALLLFQAGYAPPNFDRSTNAEDCMRVANEKTDDRFQFSFGSTTDTAATFD